MKTLKKVLALALVMALSFSLFAGATFSDAEEFTAVEAIETLVALGIIDGYTDGTFKPDQVVTRAEMAKLIYTLMNAGNDDASYWANTASPFIDMGAAEWAKGYVNYCYLNGIIAGKGQGIFDPNAPVTGLEAAKMLLTVAGYDAELAGLVGSAWALNTAKLASNTGLLNDYESAPEAGAPRQYVAQMIYNALDVYMVAYSKDTDSFVTDLTDAQTAQSVGQKYMYLAKVEGIYNGNSDFSMSGSPLAGQINVGGRTATFDADLTLVGEHVEVLFKETNPTITTGTAGDKTWYSLDKNDVVYGLRVTGDTQALRVTKGDIEVDGVKNEVKVDGTTYDFTDYTYTNDEGDTVEVDSDVYTNYVDAEATFETANLPLKADDDARNENSDFVKVVINEEGDAELAFIVENKFATIDNINDEKVQLSPGGGVELEDIITSEELEVEDVVVYNMLYSTEADEATYEMALATILEDVTVDKLNSSKEITIGDEVYKYNYATKIGDAYADIDGYDLSAAADMDADAVGEAHNFIVMNGYWVAAEAVENTVKNFAIVKKGSEVGAFTNQVQILQSDDATKTYIVNDDSTVGKETGSGADAVSSSNIVDKLVKYSTREDGTEVKLEQGDDFVNVSGSIEFIEDAMQLKVTSAAGATTFYPVADNAAVFVNYDKDTTDKFEWTWGSYVASEINDVKDTDGNPEIQATYVLDGGEVVAFAMSSKNKPAAAGTETVYGYVTSAGTYTSADTTTYDVFTGEETITLTLDGDTLGNKKEDGQVTKGAFVKFDLSTGAISNNDVTAYYATTTVAETDVAKGYGQIAITEKGTSIVGIDTDAGATKTFATDEDTKYIGVDVADTKGNGTTVTKSYADSDEKIFENALVIFEENPTTKVLTAKAVFADVDGKIGGSASDAATIVEVEAGTEVAAGVATGVAGITATTKAMTVSSDIRTAGSYELELTLGLPEVDPASDVDTEYAIEVNGETVGTVVFTPATPEKPATVTTTLIKAGVNTVTLPVSSFKTATEVTVTLVP